MQTKKHTACALVSVDCRCVSPPPAAPWRWRPAARWGRGTPECFRSESESHSCGWTQSEPDTSSPPCPCGHPAADGKGEERERRWDRNNKGRKDSEKGRRELKKEKGIKIQGREKKRLRHMRSTVAKGLRSATLHGLLLRSVHPDSRWNKPNG